MITVTGLTNANNNDFQTGQTIVYAAPSGAMTGLTNGGTYYVIRLSNSTFSLAATLADAQNGLPITLSSNGTGTQTFTLTLSARARGDTGGEENHAMSITELLSHTHVTSGDSVGSGARTGAGTFSGSFTVPATGGNSAMNNMSPFAVVNFVIKH